VKAKYLIPPFAIFGTVFLLATGELFSGTSPSFVAMMSVTLFCIAITYNLLGGLGTFSGIIFSIFSLRTIVISQFAKALLFEAADKNLEVPQLSIAVYMTFFLCALVGIFACGPLRFELPHPLEPETDAQGSLLYYLSFVIGAAATVALQIGMTTQGAQGAKNIGLAFSSLLLFSLVLAVHERIKSSNGQHSFSRKAFFPWILQIFSGYAYSSRNAMLLPSIVYLVACFVRGYRFKRRHYFAVALGLALFLLVISPFELYYRGVIADTNFKDRVYYATHPFKTTPNWAIVKASADSSEANQNSRESYFSRPGTGVLSRLSLIRADSNMFSACANGFHYGWTSIKMDIGLAVPQFLNRNKSGDASSAFTGRVTGLNSDDVPNSFMVLSPIGDAFGGFGWWGVVIFPFIIFPIFFTFLDSLFDMRQPWGTVALGAYALVSGELTMGNTIAFMIRTPLLLFVLSYLLVTIVRLIPMKGDHEVSPLHLRAPAGPVNEDLV